MPNRVVAGAIGKRDRRFVWASAEGREVKLSIPMEWNEQTATQTAIAKFNEQNPSVSLESIVINFNPAFREE